MKRIKAILFYFSAGELVLWLSSVLLITLSFVIFDKSNYLAFVASLLGVTALIFCAKGNPLGQVFMIVFCVFYGIISYTFSYYGEMLTYVLMTGPMAVVALVSWLKNPYGDSRAEVRVNRIRKREIIFMLVLTVLVTVAFYFILDLFGTANLIPSTVSVTTSFMAVYLTFRRSPFFALAYAANDIVLIVLWTLATISDVKYISVVICFSVFLINDLYGFISWRKMQKRQYLCEGFLNKKK